MRKVVIPCHTFSLGRSQAPVLVPILQRCRNSETRRKIMAASQQRCMELNGPILEDLEHVETLVVTRVYVG